MSEPVDLELGLRRKDALRYLVDLRLSMPGSEAEVRPLGQQVVSVTLDPAQFLPLLLDPVAYGRNLTAQLFADPALVAAFAAARAAAQSQGHLLRLRLAIAPDAPELHALRWETLRDPQADTPLALSEQVIFTRTLGSADWQPVVLRAKGNLRALVVIANPDGLADYNLATLDVAAEQEVALRGLAGMTTTVLAAPCQAALNLIITQLRNGYDILYIIAHGLLVDDDPYLFLDDGQGVVTPVAGSELVVRLADLPLRPRLIVLASCQSAGDGTPAALAALGPRLAIAGIPAVLAMQGFLAIATNAIFTPAFFRELQRDGRIDRALAAARQELSQQSDWWQPALFTRLRSGRIWYEPGFDAQDFAKWPTLVRSITRGKCTPILGPGLLDSLVGTTRELAQRLAEKHHFPLAPDARDDLPQVAQYLAVHQDVDFLRDELEEMIRERLHAHGSGLPARGTLDDLLAQAGAQRRAAQPNEDPHATLARLPLALFLTANVDRMLSEALAEAGKQPQMRLCPWNRYSEMNELEQEPLAPPSIDNPLVYHLFGRLDNPESLVLTEDDYFRYLIGVTRNEELFPRVVGSARVNSALLFLGFRLDDWNFRVLFQSVMNLAGAELRRRHTHVAVQIDPQEGMVLDPDAAREYLKSYFGSASALQYQTNISIYWGSAEDFLRELAGKL